MNPTELKNLIDNSTPFVPPVTEGIVVKVYDGDTFTLVSKLPYDSSPMYRFSVRINRIDCPEIKGKSIEEKDCAKLAKQCVTNLILGKQVFLQNVSTDKYGRILADVFSSDGINIGEHLINCRLAVQYDGGTKNSPINWIEYYNGGNKK